MAGQADSKAFFQKDLETLSLLDLKAKFAENGWDTHGDFAYCTPDSTGRDTEAFEKVIASLLAGDGSQKKLIPKLRRLYAKSGETVTTAYKEDAAAVPSEKVAMNAVDRAARISDLRKNLTGFPLDGHFMPSNALIDRFMTILSKGVVTYVKWESCTSRQQEVLAEPEVKSLRITSEGVLLQDASADMLCDVTGGELMWEQALRRRACAGQIGGLLTYDVHEQWHRELARLLLLPAPAGYRKIGWQQLRAADVALWNYVALRCEAGTAALGAETFTQFQKFWLEGMQAQEVRHTLLPLPSSGASSSSSAAPKAGAAAGQVKDLQNRIRQLEAGNRKRKLDAGWDAPAPVGAGKGKKGGGRQRDRGQWKAKGNGKTGKGVPSDFDGMKTTTKDDERICFGFNLPSGCSLAHPGQKCHKGKHCCMICNGPHAMQACEQFGR